MGAHGVLVVWRGTKWTDRGGACIRTGAAKLGWDGTLGPLRDFHLNLLLGALGVLCGLAVS